MDDTLHKNYEEVIRSVVAGARRTNPMWPAFFAATTGGFADRIAQVFQTNGCVPSRTQFERERTLLLWEDPAVPVPAQEPVADPEPEAVEEAAPEKPKVTRKKVEPKEPAVAEEGTADEV